MNIQQKDECRRLAFCFLERTALNFFSSFRRTKILITCHFMTPLLIKKILVWILAPSSPSWIRYGDRLGKGNNFDQKLKVHLGDYKL